MRREHLRPGRSATVERRGFREQLGSGAVAEHEAVHVVHHEERRAVDRVVRTESHDRRHRYVGVGQAGHDPALTPHVVCGGEHVAEGRTTQHPPTPCRVADVIREVRPAAGDQLEVERRGDLRPLVEPRRHRLGIDSFDVVRIAHPTHAIDMAEAGRPPRKVIARRSSWMQRHRRPGSVAAMTVDVTEQTFEAEVVERSKTTPVVIDFGRRGAARVASSGRCWRKWCPPRTARWRSSRSTSTSTRRSPRRSRCRASPPCTP